MDLTESQYRSLRAFAEGEAGWGDENLDFLMENELLDYEESYDGSIFWVTLDGHELLARFERERENGRQ